MPVSPVSPAPPSRRLAALAAALAVAGLLAACSGDTVADGSAANRGASAADVTLEEPGEEPRQRLRLSLREGQKVRGAVTMRTGIQMEVDGEPLPTAVPGSRIVVTSTVGRVEGGTARVSFVYNEAVALPVEGVNPASLEGVGVALAKVNGLRGTVSIDARGGVSDPEIDTGGIDNEAIRVAIDSMTSQFTALTVPLPDEPVGVGAVWSAKRRAKVNGVNTRTTTTYMLTSLRGTDYQLDVRQTVTAPPGPAEIPGLGRGLRTRITGYDLTNTGTIAGSLAAPLPGLSTMTGTGAVTMTVTDGTKTGELVQHMTTDVRLEPA